MKVDKSYAELLEARSLESKVWVSLLRKWGCLRKRWLMVCVQARAAAFQKVKAMEQCWEQHDNARSNKNGKTFTDKDIQKVSTSYVAMQQPVTNLSLNSMRKRPRRPKKSLRKRTKNTVLLWRSWRLVVALGKPWCLRAVASVMYRMSHRLSLFWTWCLIRKCKVLKRHASSI